jgi:8-oxo-dGTP pyrophosphatase MutT (NUDIX family)
VKIVPVTELDFRLEAYDWKWASNNRLAIEDHFARMRTQRPQLWNGRVLMLRRYQIEGAKISGAFFETDFASLVAFRSMGFPDHNVFTCAASVALRTKDGAFVLGVMAQSTANAGRVYFIAGTPDMGDVRADGAVDLIGSTLKELREEAGLVEADLRFDGNWHAVIAGSRVSLIRSAVCALTEAELLVRIRSYIASQEQPELSDVVSVRSRADFSPAMPEFICGYLDAMLVTTQE